MPRGRTARPGRAGTERGGAPTTPHRACVCPSEAAGASKMSTTRGPALVRSSPNAMPTRSTTGQPDGLLHGASGPSARKERAGALRSWARSAGTGAAGQLAPAGRARGRAKRRRRRHEGGQRRGQPAAAAAGTGRAAARPAGWGSAAHGRRPPICPAGQVSWKTVGRSGSSDQDGQLRVAQNEKPPSDRGLSFADGGRCRVRTCDPRRVKAMLYR